MINLLVIEDDDAQRMALVEYLSDIGGGKTYHVYAAGEGAVAKTVLSDRQVDMVISDLMLPDTTGIDIVRYVRSSGKNIPFLILTGQPSIETAIDAIRAGANDYLLKPVDLEHLSLKIEQLVENVKLKEENKNLRARISDSFHSGKIIGNSPAIITIIDRVKQIAPSDVTVQIEGESGTGKELIANLIHELSSRSSGPFIRVNCGALTKTILESELFGTVKGAYTGADRDRPGYFEAANGGTIFLDEIGEMDLESQVRLLRVLEEKEVVRIGSTKARKIDVRVISATNRSLLQSVENGHFREDLFYRLAVIRMTLPPLRERKEDIPLLFNHFLVDFNEKYNKSVTSADSEVMSFFMNYNWPGNIRQFRNALEAMIVMTSEDILNIKDIPVDLTSININSDSKILNSIIPGVPLEQYEKFVIQKNLNINNGNREKTASVLGISERTMYRKIKDYNLT